MELESKENVEINLISWLCNCNANVYICIRSGSGQLADGLRATFFRGRFSSPAARGQRFFGVGSARGQRPVGVGSARGQLFDCLKIDLKIVPQQIYNVSR